MGHHAQVLELFRRHFGNKEIVGIEIGTACADLTKCLLNELPNLKKLYTIDPWEHRDKAEFEAGEPQEYHDKNKALALPRLASFGDRVEMMHMTSKQAYYELKEKRNIEKVDFVHIDGDHSEAGITSDLELYEGMVKEGGIFSGHDYGQVHPLTEIILKRYDKYLHSGEDYVWYVYM